MCSYDSLIGYTNITKYGYKFFMLLNFDKQKTALKKQRNLI